jgi:hypothetical protein
MAALVMVLSFVQLWVLSSTESFDAYGLVPADERGWPEADKRGAFLLLNPGHDPKYQGDLVSLLATTEPGVVDEQSGAHFAPTDIKTVLIQSAVVGDGSDYRVYRIGEVEQQEMRASRQPGGKVMLIEPAGGPWEPGAYLVDVPSEGMYGGRTYYQFYVDPAK